MSYASRPVVSAPRPYGSRPGVPAGGPLGGGLAAGAGAGALGGALGALGGTLGCLLCLAAIGALGLFSCVVAITAYTKQYLDRFKQVYPGTGNGAGQMEIATFVLFASLFYSIICRMQRS